MGFTWMPGVERHPVGDTAPCDKSFPGKAIAHITWDKNATKSNPLPLVPFENLVDYFVRSDGRNKAPHLLWDPFTGRIAQFFPADSRSKSVMDLDGKTRTNRAGAVVIQIEALFFPYCTVDGKTYAHLTDTPCKGWDKIQDWTRSWGVLDRWPMGFPNGQSSRNEHIWETEGGWYGHSHVPENTHTDPVTWPAFIFPAKPVTTAKTVPPFPGRTFFALNYSSRYVIEVDKQLIRLGFTHHNDGNGYQAGRYYTNYTRLNVQDFQKSRGWSGKDADGFVGPKTWHDLFTL